MTKPERQSDKTTHKGI